MLSLANGSGSADDVPMGNNVSSEKLAEIAVIVMLVLFVVLSGYLLIYNIMYISVTKDIHFYGMLKTVGATSKQLRRLVYRQAIHLMLWGISIGIGLSVIASFVILPTVMTWVLEGTDSAMPTEVSFSPVIYLGTVLFSVFTVLISCRKPARLAGKVSPVEAIKYTGIDVSSKRIERHSTSGGKLYKMAFRNVFRDKKRAVLVFASLFMGVITFLSASSFFGSLDISQEKYGGHSHTVLNFTKSNLIIMSDHVCHQQWHVTVMIVAYVCSGMALENSKESNMKNYYDFITHYYKMPAKIMAGIS